MCELNIWVEKADLKVDNMIMNITEHCLVNKRIYINKCLLTIGSNSDIFSWCKLMSIVCLEKTGCPLKAATSLASDQSLGIRVYWYIFGDLNASLTYYHCDLCWRNIHVCGHDKCQQLYRWTQQMQPMTSGISQRCQYHLE